MAISLRILILPTSPPNKTRHSNPYQPPCFDDLP